MSPGLVGASVVCVMESGRCRDSLAELRVLSNCGSMTFPYCLYTLIGIPSSPAALELGKELVASCISSMGMGD